MKVNPEPINFKPKRPYIARDEQSGDLVLIGLDGTFVLTGEYAGGVITCCQNFDPCGMVPLPIGTRVTLENE